MKHSFIDRYAGLDSPLHALDARTKLIGFTALIVAALSIPSGSPFLFFAYFFLTAIFMGISQIPLQFIVGRAVLLLPFVLMAGIARPWKDGEGTALFSLLVLRSLLCLMLLILMTNTARFGELLHGMRKLGFPRILAMNLSFLYRYIFVLTEEVMRARMARECRRAGRMAWRAEIKLLGSMLGSLLLRSFERGERMYHAMLSRGSTGDFPVYSARRFTWRDLAFLAGTALFIGYTMGVAYGWI